MALKEVDELKAKNSKLEQLALAINEKYKSAKASYATYLRSMESRNQTAALEILAKHDQLQSKYIQLQNECEKAKAELDHEKRKKYKYKEQVKELSEQLEDSRRQAHLILLWLFVIFNRLL